MGKGDRKSKRGKIFAGSFGVRRRRKDKKPAKVETPVQEVKTVKTRKKQA